MGLTRGRSVQPIYYGWWVVVGALAATALFGGLYTWSFGLYFAPVETAFGWTRTEVSLGVSIALLAAGAASPFVGRLTDRRGPRLVVLIGALLGAGGMALLSTASALWHWYLYSGLMGIAVAMAFFIGLQALAASWFQQRRGKALGLLGLGVSLGGFALVPAVRLMIDTLGWEGSLQLSAGLVLALYLPLAFFVFRDGPARQADGSHPDAPAAAAGARPAAEGVSLRAALRTPIFWTLTLGISLYFYAAFGLVVHSVPFFEDEGFNASEAAGFLSAMAGVSILSRIVLAATVDRARRFERVAMLLAVSGMITLGLLLIGTSPGVIVVFVLFWSIADTGPAADRAAVAVAGVRSRALRVDLGSGECGADGGNAGIGGSGGGDLRRNGIVYVGTRDVLGSVRRGAGLLLGVIAAAAPDRPGGPAPCLGRRQRLARRHMILRAAARSVRSDSPPPDDRRRSDRGGVRAIRDLARGRYRWRWDSECGSGSREGD